MVLHIKKLHRVAPGIGAEVRVAHGHRDVRVPKELLQCLEGRPSHDQVGGKGMSKRVPAD